MSNTRSSVMILTLSALWLAPFLALAQTPDAPAPPAVDLSDFRSLDKAITTQIKAFKSSTTPVSLPGYLGINVKPNDKSVLSISQVQANSPASKAGLQPGDVLVKVAGQAVSTADALRGLLQAKGPGESIAIEILRDKKPIDMKVTLEATSRPQPPRQVGKGGPPGKADPMAKRAVMGVQVSDPKDGGGVQLDVVTPDAPAANAGLVVSDVIVKIDGKPVKDTEQFREVLAQKKPGDKVTLTVQGQGKEKEVAVTLQAAAAVNPRGPAFEEQLRIWDKDVYRLAVVVVDFADIKVNDRIELETWQDALFSSVKYTKSATGELAFGSLNDYFQEQSFGKFHIEGRVFEVVHAVKKRAEYYQGAGGGAAAKTVLLAEALKKLTESEADALKNFDGLCFIYAGAAVRTDRGSLYYPHRGVVQFQGKRWPYIICPEGGKEMESISVFAPQFAKLLGLPDLAARPEDPGSKGLGVWCLMGGGTGKKGKPGHLNAWCKEQLGWLHPTVIDPTTKQKLILGHVQSSAKECVKVLARPDGSEYFLLENRTAKGFDNDLPGHGLLIWRVSNGRPILEESHGVQGPSGPRVFLDAVPYPSKANNSFTPNTTPSSQALSGGGLPVHITNIRRLPDGRITLFVGYEYY